MVVRSNENKTVFKNSEGEYYTNGGWFNGGGGGYTQGNRPYDNKTINLQSNAYIIADSSRYD